MATSRIGARLGQFRPDGREGSPRRSWGIDLLCGIGVRHFLGSRLGEQLAAPRRSVGQRHGPAYALQVRRLRENISLWSCRLREIARDIECLLDACDLGKHPPSLEGIDPHSAARIVAAVSDPARSRSAGAFAADVGVALCLRQSVKTSGRIRATIASTRDTRLRSALSRPALGGACRNPRLHIFCAQPHVAGIPLALALVAGMRRLLHAISFVAKHRKPFVANTGKSEAA